MSETSGLFCGKGCCLYCSTPSVRTGHRAYLKRIAHQIHELACLVCVSYMHAVYVLPYMCGRICIAVYVLPYMYYRICIAVYVWPYLYVHTAGIRAGQGAYRRASYTPNTFAVYVCLIRMPYMYALYVCRICMPYTYTVYVCLMRMPYTHALYVCRICMPYSYAVYACLIRMPYLSLCVCFIRMPYTYAVYVCLIRMPYMYCRIPGIRAGQGAYGRASCTPNSTPTEQ